MRNGIKSCIVAVLTPAIVMAITGCRTQSETGGTAVGESPSLQTLLQCSAEALGGTAVTALSKIEIVLQSTPPPELVGVPAETRVISIKLPSDFTKEIRSPRPGVSLPDAINAWGFSGARSFARRSTLAGTMEPVGIEAETLRRLKHEFARLLLVWLVRTADVVPTQLSLSGFEGPPRHRQALVGATGPDSFNAVLRIDEASCLPVSISTERPATMSDSMRERILNQTVSKQTRTETIFVSGHAPVEGLMLPTTMRIEVDGATTANLVRTSATVE